MHAVLFLVGTAVLTVTGILVIRWSVLRGERKFDEAFKQFDQEFDRAEEAAMQAMEARMEQEEAEEQAFRARAKRYPASITSARQIGEHNLKPLLALQLAIEAPEGVYEVKIKYAPDVQEAHRYARGSTIEVYVDPNDRQNVKCGD
jgi:hypothetical protein